MVDVQSLTADNRRGNKGKRRRKKNKIETTAAKYNGLPYWAVIRKKEETTAVKHNGLPIIT